MKALRTRRRRSAYAAHSGADQRPCGEAWPKRSASAIQVHVAGVTTQARGARPRQSPHGFETSHGTRPSSRGVGWSSMLQHSLPSLQTPPPRPRAPGPAYAPPPTAPTRRLPRRLPGCPRSPLPRAPRLLAGSPSFLRPVASPAGRKRHTTPNVPAPGLIPGAAALGIGRPLTNFDGLRVGRREGRPRRRVTGSPWAARNVVHLAGAGGGPL